MLTIALGKMEDFEFYYELKCEKSAVYWSGYADAPDYHNLKRHYQRVILDETLDTEIYFVKDNNCNVGYVQVLHNSENEVEIAVGVTETGRGKGYGTYAIGAALKLCYEKNESSTITCYIREDNVASEKAFAKNGFVKKDSYKEHYFPQDATNFKMYLHVHE